ncbi:MAG: GntR family transcriptional regulator, partial [Acidobacteriota bacterium]|nr:GntR family transcriptional regulator [Acidobacteriota bacterium]
MAEISLRKLPPGENTPLYAQIMGILEQEIRSGRLKPGDQLPTQEALAQHFEVSLAPVKQALRELEERGVIATRQGRGTYILDATPLSEEIIDANRIPNFTRDMAEMGREPSSRVLSI